MTLIVI